MLIAMNKVSKEDVMKNIRNQNRWIALLSLAIISSLVLTAFVNVGTAYADEGLDPEKGQAGDRIDDRLEAFLEKLNEWYAVQDENIGKANQAIARIEELLDKAADLGIDTSEIEALMPSLYAAVGRAEAAHANADEILSEHAGFNGGGKVKDRKQALETCRSAHEALKSAKDSLLEARDIVHEIIEIAKELRQNYAPSTEVAS
jgi:hypothetical protein